MIALRVLSALLTYPDSALRAALPELRQAMAQADAPPAARASALLLIHDLAASDGYEAEARYIELFDRVRSLSLHLFEHVHGDSRERGPAMVALHEMYAAQGLHIDASDLPDFLPIYLEAAALLDRPGTIERLGQIAALLAMLRDRLKKRGSPYACAFDALLTIAGRAGAENETGEEPAEPDVDKVWEEAQINFGAGAATAERESCPVASDVVARMNAPLARARSAP
ncbi:MAG: nitrate reductase molybdenum cofactor assembly chaperone [Reyranellales bacterium]